jgi:hypothetical protein
MTRFFLSAWMVAFAWSLACGFATAAAPETPPAPPQQTTLIVVVGAAGEESYGRIFAEEAAAWRKLAEESAASLHVVGVDAAGGPTDRERLQQIILEEREAAASAPPLWLVFLGHGTFDGRRAAFNLRGPDVDDRDLVEWLKPCRRPLVVVDTTAASAPFLTSLSAPGRVVITATKSGQQRNYARFGRYFVKRVVDPAADLDKDEQTSLFEAWLAAGRDTADFYKNDGRIPTETPLLDDDGDARGVRIDFFAGARLVRSPGDGATVDGDLARRIHLRPSDAERKLTPAQTAERDRLEGELAALRRRKAELSEDSYFTELERVLLALARVYERR